MMAIRIKKVNQDGTEEIVGDIIQHMGFYWFHSNDDYELWGTEYMKTKLHEYVVSPEGYSVSIESIKVDTSYSTIDHLIDKMKNTGNDLKDHYFEKVVNYTEDEIHKLMMYQQYTGLIDSVVDTLDLADTQY